MSTERGTGTNEPRLWWGHQDALGGQGAPAFEVARASRLASAAWWSAAGVLGGAAMAVPHGPGTSLLLGAALCIGALGIAGIALVRGLETPVAWQFVEAVAAAGIVAVALLGAGPSPMIFAAVAFCLVLTVHAAWFFVTPAFASYLVLQTATVGSLLLASGQRSGPTAWVATTLTTCASGWVVHVLRRGLGKMATTDPLTGLLNRRTLEVVVQQEMAQADRLGQPLCLAVIDLDDFQQVNQSQGHRAGDRLLVEVVRSWQHVLRPSDALARSGGDEFVLLLPAADAPRSIGVLERLRSVTPHGFSAGIAALQSGDSVETLLHRADRACFRAKQAGRGHVTVGA